MGKTTGNSNGLPRRDFIKGSGAVIGAIGASIGLAGCSSTTDAQETDTASVMESASETTPSTTDLAPITEELPIPEVAAPEITSYTNDLLVIGGGWAGISAAVEAKKEGKDVILVDKAFPGYSGYSPWSSAHQFFDETLGDDGDALYEEKKLISEYTCNYNWIKLWMDESRETYETVKSWGMFEEYDNASVADIDGFLENKCQEYYQSLGDKNRHSHFYSALEDAGVPVVPYTMIVDIVKNPDGTVVGAVGFDVRSGAFVDFSCKAVVLAVGAGCYKPMGYPTGSSTLDGEGMGYRLGLGICGKEYTDFHGTGHEEPGNCMTAWTWAYAENYGVTRGKDYNAEFVYTPRMAKGLSVPNTVAAGGVAPTPDNTIIEQIPYSRPEEDTVSQGPGNWGNFTTDLEDPRTGLFLDYTSSMDNLPNASLGMGNHKSEGIWPGNDVVDGSVGLDGLYVAGDCLASMTEGAVYYGVGLSSNMSATQGRIAAKTACAFLDTVDLVGLTDEQKATWEEYVLQPMTREKGYDPNWARDYLVSIMGPYWVNNVKTEATLNTALAQVEYMRDNILPNLVAANSHDLRNCHEMRNKITSAEIKLHAGLARKESRGMHYRADYPFRDDTNFLVNNVFSMGENGEMKMETVPFDEKWIGDISDDYATRYPGRFPGEAEALGLEVEQKAEPAKA